MRMRFFCILFLRNFAKGGEMGVHFGKNSIFLIGQYNHGFRSIASGIPGSAFNRSYGVTLQYRRMIF